jgi:hypothetical protein
LGGSVLAAEISLGCYLAHIVHCGGYGGFDTRVDGGGVDCHSSPTANAYDSDFFGVNVVLDREKIHRRKKILGVDILKKFAHPRNNHYICA